MKKKSKRIKVILLAAIKSLGNKGEVKNVSIGYARNLLIPHGLVVIATPDKIKLSEEKLKRAKNKETKNLKRFQEMQMRLDGLELVFTGLSAQDKKLFGSVGKKEIIEKIAKTAKIKIRDGQLDLDKSLKEKGEYQIPFQMTPEIKGNFRIIIK